MCFGSGSHYPLQIGWERMGSNHDLLRFRARGFPAFVSVHWTSCMPYIGHVKTWDNVTDVRLAHDNGPHPHLRTHADDGDASGHADDGATHDQQHLLVRPKWQSLKGMVFRDPEVGASCDASWGRWRQSAAVGSSRRAHLATST